MSCNAIVASDRTGVQQIDHNLLEIAHYLYDTVTQVAADVFIMVNAQHQQLHVFQEKTWQTSYNISTALNGVGQIKGSGKTPLGLHKVVEKYGDNTTNLYAIFESRIDTGHIASIDDSKAYITTRILRLAGLQKGFNLDTNNQGAKVDSYDRYIYIHGTNVPVGQPTSAGCVRLGAEDMVDLFSRVESAANIGVFIY